MTQIHTAIATYGRSAMCYNYIAPPALTRSFAAYTYYVSFLLQNEAMRAAKPRFNYSPRSSVGDAMAWG